MNKRLVVRKEFEKLVSNLDTTVPGRAQKGLAIDPRDVVMYLEPPKRRRKRTAK